MASSLFDAGEKCLDHFSPAGLKVLVVDDDPFCLTVLERMLRECKYAVTTCSRATTALTILRERKESFDVVISDVHMPDMDGFKLLELIGLEMGLPVIMMSANGETDVVMKGVVYGACDYLVKPVRIEELRNIWQHVVRRRGGTARDSSARDEAPDEWEDFVRSTATDSSEDADNSAANVDARLLKRKKLHNSRLEDDAVRSISSSKKARVVWSFDLHQQFVKAINHIGIDKAVPKRILEVMNIQGLTRENVASHLQKYRLYLKRLSGVTPEPFPIASFQAYDGAAFGGTMQVHQHPSAIASSKSHLARSKSASAAHYNAATLATLKQLQAIQQAAHEQGQLDKTASLTQLGRVDRNRRFGGDDHRDHAVTTNNSSDISIDDDEGELLMRDDIARSSATSFLAGVFQRQQRSF